MRQTPVTLMFHDPVDRFLSAHVDNFAAAGEIARQFLQLGHRRTGFLALRFSTSDRSRNRYAGFLAECRRHGLPDPALIEISESEARHPEKLATILLGQNGLTAIFASNDFLAIAVQTSARLLGWRVPEDLSVAGFDGIEIGRLLEAPLATIETSPEQMGRQAARLLLQILQGKEVIRPPALPFQFRFGGTLAPPNPENGDDDRGAARPSSVSLAQDHSQTRINR